MIRTQTDSTSDYSVADLTKKRQTRRESKVDWSDRMLGSSSPSNCSLPSVNTANKNHLEASKMKDEFFSLLMDDSKEVDQSEIAADSNFVGTKNKNFSLNKQEEKKSKLEVIEYEVSTKDFGSAKVEVQVVSNQVFLVVHVDQFVPEQHTQILQRLVASRLAHQFGKNFEVQIKCKT